MPPSPPPPLPASPHPRPFRSASAFARELDDLWTPADGGQPPPELASLLRFSPNDPRSPRAAAARRRSLLRACCFLLGFVAAGCAAGVGAAAAARAPDLAGVVATAAAFALAACVVAGAEIAQHVTHAARPALQRHEVRILLLVPVYALSSLASLAFPRREGLLRAVREVYEAVALHAFTAFMLALLAADAALSMATLPQVLASKPQVRHLWPVSRLCSPWPMGEVFLSRVRAGVLSYVVARPLTAAVGLCLAPFKLYREGDLSPHGSYLYLAIINALFQGWALYCLILLYRAAEPDLLGSHVRILAKFMCAAINMAGATTDL